MFNYIVQLKPISASTQFKKVASVQRPESFRILKANEHSDPRASKFLQITTRNLKKSNSESDGLELGMKSRIFL